MMLTEETPAPGEALPVQGLKDHLRLGTGFADDGMQDGLMAAHLRAAIGVIEGRTGKMLLTRRFCWQVPAWRTGAGQALPVAPVTVIVALRLRDAAGVAAEVAPARYRLRPDLHRPRLEGASGALPAVPREGVAEVVFEAGFGPAWGDVPPDLAQAVLLLAAELYERRHEAGLRAAGLPFGVTVLIERWRTVRMLGGGGA